MSILSISFIFLLIGVFVAYYLFPEAHRWIVLLAASTLFYLAASGRAIIYLLITSGTVFVASQGMQMIADRQKMEFKTGSLSREEKASIRKQNKGKRKALLLGSLIVSVGLLCFFKYIPEAARKLSIMTEQVNSILVPLGISFYTFNAVGYLVDVYGENCRAEKNYFRLLLFLSFFPQITQGPISSYDELAKTLYAGKTPEEENLRHGLARLLWGFMKKMVIANTLAANTMILFENYGDYAGISILFGAYFYLIQLYADFSGYMDIMCGFCEMLGILLQENFNRPFFSKSISEYWRRWHISLGQWFRKYVYYPIGVSGWNLKFGKFCRSHVSRHAASCLPPTIALIITWFLTGLWHGATAGYIVWGLANGTFIILSLWLAPWYEQMRKLLNMENNRFWQIFRILRTFTIVALLEVLPEVGTLQDGFHFWSSIVTNWYLPSDFVDILPFVYFHNFNKTLGFAVAMVGVLLLFCISMLQRKKPLPEAWNAIPVWLQVLLLSALILVIGTFGIQASWGAEGFMYANF